MGSTGSENGVFVMKNVNFDHTADPPRTGIITEDGHLIIGNTDDPNIAALAGHITSTTLEVDYDAPDITIETKGGGQPVERFAMQTGTNPVVPTATGLVTFNGAVVAQGTNPVRTDGTGANTMALEVQISQAIAATDATKIGLCNFNSSDFTVDANGFVEASGTGIGQTITGNTGGALSPTAGNWNIVTDNATVVFAGAGSTLTQNFGITNLLLGSEGPSIAGATNSVGVGNNALNALTSGVSNVAVGAASLDAVTTGNENTAVGNSTLSSITGGGQNTAVGSAAMSGMTAGSNNTAIGYNAGSALTSSNSNNIYLGANVNGVAGEDTTTRIGAAQTACYIDGVYDVDLSTLEVVTIANTDQIGSSLLTAGTGIDIVAGAGIITISADGDTSQMLTPDFDFDGSAATPVEPQAGNINVLSYNPSPTNTFTNSTLLTLNSTGASTGNLSIENRTWTTQYIVDPSTTVGSRGTYSTIASAYAAAKGAGSGTIFIRAGTYTENIAMDTAGVNLCAYNCDGQSQTAGVTIVGKLTVTYSGSASISGIALKGNSDNYISLTGGSASKLYLYNCTLNASGATGINLNRSGAYIFCQYCTWVITDASNPFVVSAGLLYHINCSTLNWGFDTTATASAGNLFVWDTVLQYILSTSGTNSLELVNSEIRGNNTVCLTVGGSGENFAKNCSLLSGTAASVSVGSNMRLQNVTLDTTNANAITGAGTVEWASLNSSDIVAINTTTQTPLLQFQAAVKITSPGAYPYTAKPQDHVILVDTSAARTINLNASPQTGQIYRIKDNVGSAAANNITITPAAGNIDGAGSATINVAYGSMDVCYQGSMWIIL